MFWLFLVPGAVSLFFFGRISEGVSGAGAHAPCGWSIPSPSATRRGARRPLPVQVERPAGRTTWTGGGRCARLALADGDGMAPSLTPAPCGRGLRGGPGPSRSPRPRRRHPPARACSRTAGGLRRRCPVIGSPPFPLVTEGSCNHRVLVSPRYVTDCGGPRAPRGPARHTRKGTVRIDARAAPARAAARCWLAGTGGLVPWPVRHEYSWP